MRVCTYAFAQDSKVECVKKREEMGEMEERKKTDTPDEGERREMICVSRLQERKAARGAEREA